VTTGTPVTLRFRTFHDDVTDVTVRVWSTAAGAQTLYPMELVATTDDPPYGYDYWQATIPAQDEPTILWYRFIVRDGSDEDFYEDDDRFDGGWGTPYDDSPDYSFQIDVYESDFETPEWMKNAVVGRPSRGLLSWLRGWHLRRGADGPRFLWRRPARG
jgi:hypothetical protein